jgi:rubredoxin
MTKELGYFQVDDVLGGSAAWENVDWTEATCPKCDHGKAFFMQIQTRFVFLLVAATASGSEDPHNRIDST